ncbi:hypothetical protein C942_00494 [Photobacterium marinum]|uniref:Phage terminase small subunit n=2 Tax=Photobacterium marinum TaxID=1056511 RepID=L8JF54_9GAMM|nr:hypothetical protein C942_00494 [Photobacterium marinum]
MESKGIESAEYKYMGALFAVEYNEYISAIKDIEANGQTITVKGANGYPVCKQNPAVQTKQAAFKNIMEIVKQSGLSPKSAKDINGSKEDENAEVLKKFLQG